MTKRETSYTVNIHLTSGTVFKLHLRDDWQDHWDPAWVLAPTVAGPKLIAALSRDEPARNTLAAIDWSRVDAITYRRPAEGSAGRPASVTGDDIIAALETMPGRQVASVRQLCDAIDAQHGAVSGPLRDLHRAGVVEQVPGPRRALGYRLVTASQG